MEINKQIKKGKQLNYRIPIVSPVHFNDATLPIDPYVLGVWLGDGSKDSARFIAETKDFPHLKYEMERFMQLSVNNV